MTDSTQRFSSRVADYVKYRPGYPPALIDLLRSECGLTETSVIADIGSGTGLLAEPFLRNGNLVFGVEPNQEMREAGERLLSDYASFRSVAGAAEGTTLEDQSVDFVMAGQAFHWFKRDAARREWTRILKPEGWVVLVWNERRTATPFLEAYEQLLLTYGTDYQTVDHRNIDETTIASFYGSDGYTLRTFGNSQDFDYDGLEGRLRSSSYTLEPGHANYAPMLAHLRELFDRNQVEGKVHFEYETSVYYGHLDGGSA